MSRFSPFNCCLSVVLQLDKGDYPDHLQTVCVIINKRSFEPFMCLKQPLCFSIDELRAYGLIDVWNSRWMNKSHCTVSIRPEGPVVISLSHLQGAFYVMAGGAGLSALLLVVEMCVGKRCFAQQK